MVMAALNPRMIPPMKSLTEQLGDLRARDRERLMLSLIGQMARGEILLSSVANDGDLRQLAYLAGMARNRVRSGGDRLQTFFNDARKTLGSTPPPKSSRSPGDLSDPLQEMLGAAFAIDAGKLRSEVNLHLDPISAVRSVSRPAAT